MPQVDASFGSALARPGRRVSADAIRYEKGIVYLYPLPRNWQRLQELHYKVVGAPQGPDPLVISPRLSPEYAQGAYRYSLACTLGHFAVLDTKSQVAVYTSLLDFITAARSFDGLESVFLTTLNVVGLAEDRALFRRGRALWNRLGPPKQIGGGWSTSPFLEMRTHAMGFLDKAELTEVDAELKDPAIMGASAVFGERILSKVADDANQVMSGDNGEPSTFAKSVGIAAGVAAGAVVAKTVGAYAGTAGGGAAGAYTKSTVETWVLEEIEDGEHSCRVIAGLPYGQLFGVGMNKYATPGYIDYVATQPGPGAGDESSAQPGDRNFVGPPEPGDEDSTSGTSTGGTSTGGTSTSASDFVGPPEPGGDDSGHTNDDPDDGTDDDRDDDQPNPLESEAYTPADWYTFGEMESISGLTAADVRTAVETLRSTGETVYFPADDDPNPAPPNAVVRISAIPTGPGLDASVARVGPTTYLIGGLPQLDAEGRISEPGLLAGLLADTLALAERARPAGDVPGSEATLLERVGRFMGDVVTRLGGPA
jgi:hypothetical protein